nr:MAG TPA: hypothetical protein [Caudoviricetes sp.]
MSLSLLRFFYRTFDVVQSVLAGSDRKYLIFKLQKFVIDYKSISITSCRITLQKSTRFFVVRLSTLFILDFTLFSISSKLICDR